MLIAIQQTIFKAAPNNIDTLKNSVNQLQIKLDSLNSIVTKTEIGQGYFSDILSAQLWTFSAFLAVLALISWGVIAGMLALHKSKIEKNSESLINELSELTQRQLSEMQLKLGDVKHDTCRSMYAISCTHKGNGVDAISANWALNIVSSLIERHPDRIESINIWLKTANDHLEKVPIGTDVLLRKESEHDEILQQCNLIQDKETIRLKNITKALLINRLLVPDTLESPTSSPKASSRP